MEAVVEANYNDEVVAERVMVEMVALLLYCEGRHGRGGGGNS